MKHFISSLSVINANTPPCEGRVSSRKILSLLLILFLSIGNVWAETVTWEKATSIAAGDVVALVCESKKMELSSFSSNYGVGTAYTSTPAGLYELTVESGSSTGTFSFKKGTTYLYWTSGNSLATNATKNANTSWKVTFSNGNATILNAKDNSRKLQWNASSPRFACYTSNQTAVQLYKKVTSDDIIVKTLKSIEVTPKTINYETGDVFKFDGTCTATYSVTKNGEPQADETAVVNPTTVSTPDMSTADTKEITVTYTEDGVTVTDTYEIEVTQNEVTPGAYTGNLNNTFFGCAVGNNATEQSGKFDDVLVVAGCKSSATSKTNYQSGHVRFYADSYLTLSVPTGYVIKSIVFTADGTWSGSITVSAGTYDNNSKTWTGNAQEVKFSFAAQNRIKSVKVTYAADVKNALNITTPSNGTLVVKDGSTVLADGAQVYEGTKLVVTPTPATGYVFESLTVDGSAVELTDGSYTFNMPAANVIIAATFKENEKPAATLTLSKNGETEDITGHKQGDKVELPSITSDCVKEFVGWSADVNCATEPEYKEGEEYTLAETAQTLYAVYATVGGGGETTAANTLSSNGWVNESKHTSLQIDANVKATVAGKDNSGKYYNSGTDWRLYQSENATITISTTVGELKSVKFTFTNSSDGTLLYGSTKLTSGNAVEVSGTSATFSVSDTNEDENKGQIRFTAIEVVYTGGVSYSDYSTTCSAALANPTFSLTEGKYTEAKSIEIEYTEGTVYYTMDGTEPTASSTQYTGAIALNDCGEYTIKAIAISADSRSDVVSATYTIKLPLTNSQAAPYTETEAIAVYDGDCYDNQDVYVKGTVKTATFYSSSSTYTITLTNGFQFYKFYKDGSKATFTDGAINTGDVLVACGKLSKYNTTYQLAEGCYLVEHEPYTEPKTDISNTEATAYTVDKAFELIADVKSDLTKEVYVKGLVAVAPTSNPTADGQMTYSISDNGENTGNVLKVYLGLNLNGDKFTSKNDVQQGDYVVVKGKLLDYNSTYELNKGNQLVQHKKAATISIADITMEVGETKTIAATITPAAAKTEVAYSIKENAANAISLSGNVITANTVGSATITATIATAADYMGKTIDFTVTVNAKSTKVVILAEYEGQWYAMKAQYVTGRTSHLAPLPVTYFDGKLYNVNEADKALIEWERAVVDGKATFYNDGKYLTGKSGDTDLTLAATACEWTISEDSYLIGARTFLYNAENNWFRNFGTGNAGDKNYSDMPTVTAPVYVNLNTSSVKAVEKGIFSVADAKFVQFSTGNLQYEVGTNTWSFAENQYDYVGEENINVGNPSYTGKIDMFGWSADGKFGVNPSNTDDDYNGDFVDWGTLVNEEDWYTLSADEWKYLLNKRTNASSLKQIARVGSVVGIMLFPDAWTMPADVNVAAAYDDYFKVNIYNYTLEQWEKLEAVGAVFLPAAGRRTGGWGNTTISPHMVGVVELDSDGHYKHYDNGNIYCYYWTSTINEDKNVSYLHNIQALGGDKYTIGTGAVWGEKGRYGQSVRLVKAIKPDHTRTVTSGDYGTICLPNGGLLLGASAFSVAKMEGTTILLDEVGTTMVAGTPYVVFPNTGAKKLYVFYTDNEDAPAGKANGLYGSYTREELAPNAGNYIMLPGNRYAEVTGDRVYVAANRAYFKVSEISTTAPAPAPGVRRIAIGQAPQVATGMENVDASAQPVKTIINGQLFILRGEKMYDAQGKLVK